MSNRSHCPCAHEVQASQMCVQAGGMVPKALPGEKLLITYR